MAKQSWEDLPDVKPAASWEDLPDVDTKELVAKTQKQALAAVPEPKSTWDSIKEVAGAAGKMYGDEQRARNDVVGDLVGEKGLGKRSGLAQGLTSGLSDEMTGALNAATMAAGGLDLSEAHNDLSKAKFTKPARSWEELAAAYEKARDASRGGLKTAKASDPTGYLGGEIAGGLAQGLAVPNPTTALRAGLTGAGLGAANALGHSDKSLENTDLTDLAIQTGAGGALGVAGQKAAGWMGGKLAAVKQKNLENMQKAADKAFASARSAHGAEVASGARILEVAERSVDDPTVSDVVRQRAQEFLASPEAAALKERVALSNIARGYDSTGRIARTADEMAEAGVARGPGAVASKAQARLDDPSALIRRVRELGPKVVLPIVGGALAGPAGAGAGALSSSVLGRSATTVRNALADPYVASRVLGLGSAVTQSLAPATTRTGLNLFLDSLNDDEKQPEDPWQGIAGGGK